MMVMANEWESTIRIPSTREVYDQATGHIDIIFLFNNGTRLSMRRVERKRTLTSKYVLGFYHGNMIPICRTTAHEELVNIMKDAQIERVSRRKIQILDHNIRLAFIRDECDMGERYSIEYEIEYNGGKLSYNEILEKEELLMRAAVMHNHLAKCKNMTLESIFGCVMTKVQMWHCFDPAKPYRWAYKWNGMKAKLMIPSISETEENIAYVWPDADVIRTEPFYGDRKLFENLSLLVEIMDEVMVVIEIIGTQFENDNNIYTTEPTTNLRMLKYLRHHTDLGGCSNRVGKRTLLIQTFFDQPLPVENNFDDLSEQYDGYIIAQGDTMIKWKLPTIDVKCVSPYTYQVSNQIYTLVERGIVNAIYEMAPDQRLLRRRTDRLAASTDSEFELFQRSIKLLHHKRISPTLPSLTEMID
nr:lef-4-like protein [Apis mellifera nudivirus]